MNLVELLLVAVGVAMDAFAVSICKGLSLRVVKPRFVLLTALWFGGFQALMPLIGYFLGISFAEQVIAFDHWVAFVLLGLIGGNMIKDSFRDEVCHTSPDFSFSLMLGLAVATSIDALAIGVSFAFLKVNIWSAVLVIGFVTAAFSGLGVVIGRVFGCRYKSKAEFTGGIILILMGIRILLTHLIG